MKGAPPGRPTQIHQENPEPMSWGLNQSVKNLGQSGGSGTAAWLMHVLEHVRYPKTPDGTWFVLARRLGSFWRPTSTSLESRQKRFLCRASRIPASAALVGQFLS